MGSAHAGRLRKLGFPLTIYGILALLGAVLFILLVPRSFSEAQPEARDPNPGRKTDIPEGLINGHGPLTFASMAGGLAAYGYLALYPTYIGPNRTFR